MAIAIFIVLSGCTERPVNMTEASAIELAQKQQPDFPIKAGEIRTVKQPTGGPSGSTTNIEYTTMAEKNADGEYLVTFLKDWNFVINDLPIISYWKYKVGSNGVFLIESQDKDYWMSTVK